MIQFDPATHTYTLDGTRLVSVTQALKAAGIIDDTWYSSEACLRGTYVAQATELADRGELDEENLDPALKPYVDAWKGFLLDTGCRVVTIESPVWSSLFGYAGTLDRVVNFGHGIDCIVDIKTGGVEDWHQLQTAAYQLALEMPADRMAVYLRDDGTYSARSHTDPNDSKVFLAAVAVANWKLNHGGRL